jgi:nucleotidyltransferase substrate binding protein (TIGR01987 family)
MTIQGLIQAIKNIILEHANPDRIYLYGSHASGEADEGSDIDIAFDDPDLGFEQLDAIEQAINELETLQKIDVKNLAHTSERFQNRVKSTGKVLYSHSKKQRFEDQLYNFNNALERFNTVVNDKDTFYKEGFSDVYLDVAVKRFEFTFEMAWKAIRRYLDFSGVTCKSPRACFKEAFAQGLVEEEGVWLEMIEFRNLSTHIYNEQEIQELLDYVSSFSKAFNQLKAHLEQRLAEEA